MGIIQRIGAFRQKCIAHVITDGEQSHEFKFYAPRFRNICTGRTRELLEPIIQAAAVIMSGGARSTQHVIYSDKGTPAEVSTIAPEVESVNAEELRRRNAISDALGVLFSEHASQAIGELLADSLRDEFPARGSENYDAIVRQFMDELSIDMLVQFLVGYFKAMMPLLDAEGNSTRSGPLEWVRQKLGARAGVIAKAVEQVAEETGVPIETLKAMASQGKSSEPSTSVSSS